MICKLWLGEAKGRIGQSLWTSLILTYWNYMQGILDFYVVTENR